VNRAAPRAATLGGEKILDTPGAVTYGMAVYRATTSGEDIDQRSRRRRPRAQPTQGTARRNGCARRLDPGHVRVFGDDAIDGVAGGRFGNGRAQMPGTRRTSSFVHSPQHVCPRRRDPLAPGASGPRSSGVTLAEADTAVLVSRTGLPTATNSSHRCRLQPPRADRHPAGRRDKGSPSGYWSVRTVIR